jgi:hypothetical protein
VLSIKTILLTVHVSGLLVGMGTALFLDLHLFRFLRGRLIRDADVDVIHLGSCVVALGLGLLWISGIGFVTLAWTTDPAVLQNPKLHSKLLAVSVLTINGILLHLLVLPRFAANLHRPLFAGLSVHERIAVVASGAVSGASWLYAFLLGMIRELNFAAPVQTFLWAYCALLLGALVAATVMSWTRAMTGSLSPQGTME